MNCFHGRELKWKASFFKWEKSKWINSVILFLKCVNFNRTVSLVETLFCQKISNQSYSQQQLVKMAALGLWRLSQQPRAVWPVRQPAPSFACEELLLPREGVGRSPCLLPLHSCLQSPQFPSFAALQLRITSCSVLYQMANTLLSVKWQTMISQGFTSYPTVQI